MQEVNYLRSKENKMNLTWVFIPDHSSMNPPVNKQNKIHSFVFHSPQGHVLKAAQFHRSLSENYFIFLIKK